MGMAEPQVTLGSAPRRRRVSWLARTALGAETKGQVGEALAAYAIISPWLMGLLFLGSPPLIPLFYARRMLVGTDHGAVDIVQRPV